jgi:hypothetical protein
LGVAVVLLRGVLPVDAPPTTRGGWGNVSFKAEWELKVEVDRPGKDDVK